MTLRIGVPDLISPSYFPAIAAVELGFFAAEGLDARIELVFPVTKTYQEQADGAIDFVAGSAHAALYVYQNWAGCKLVCALSQNMYWFLVVRSDLEPRGADLDVLRGLRIAAAPGPVDGLRRMLHEARLDPDRDLDIVPVPGSHGAGVSFGVSAARALETGAVDGFWANGMGAQVAVDGGFGTVLIDARRGDGPDGAVDYTFPAMVATDDRIENDRDTVAGAVRAIVAAQKALKEDPSRAEEAAAGHFPAQERSLITELVRRDAPFYDPSIPEPKVEAMNRFSEGIGILGSHRVDYHQVVATGFESIWR